MQFPLQVHRDIKPENILVTKTAMSISAKICDFGSATRINPTKLQKVDRSGEKDLSHYLGSRWYYGIIVLSLPVLIL